ncbi:AraC family transcriptional regulator [Sinimarinibacterium sp. CAU 1509]|uniref:AraC family transcriptional regulator n=1 Tax=Sinimarinibacterium sp. CAU 1509 TaxID=2562283 RepID=UPI0010ACBF7C|nr:AraC family transcriptional regulator [Sinimarinibacterium sp. CAU 1509]TJY60997.1 AraC family transcriptional regulator [Sinimarinibacterium sp. CAU 1509]
MNSSSGGPIRVTGAWTGLLSDWLDREQLAAPAIRARLARYAPDDPVPVRDWRMLLEQATQLRPALEAPGLVIGSGVMPHHVGVLGYLVLASDTLAEAMAAYQRYERLFYGINIAEVRITHDQAQLRWVPTETGPIADETAIAALVTFIQRQSLNNAPPSRVCFVHTASVAHARACEDFFRCPVEFGSSHTVVQFPTALLATPMRHHEPGLRALLDRQAQALLKALPDSNAFDQAVQQVLLRQLPDGNVHIDKVASALHQSTRTLQRRLADSGMTWQQLLDRTREQLARQYLHDRGLSLAEIALLLGYSEQSTFIRAFRRWVGTTPLAFRRKAPA